MVALNTSQPDAPHRLAVALTELLVSTQNDREGVARAVVSRLPHGSHRSRCEAELGNVDAARLALNAAATDRHASGAALFIAAREVGESIDRVENLIWRAFSSLAHAQERVESPRPVSARKAGKGGAE